MDNELIIEQKDAKGEDGYKIISLRIKEKDAEKLDLPISETINFLHRTL